MSEVRILSGALNGLWRSLVAHGVRDAAVAGSNAVNPTMERDRPVEERRWKRCTRRHAGGFESRTFRRQTQMLDTGHD